MVVSSFFTHTYLNTSIHTCTHTHTCVHTYTHTYIYIYIYKHIYAPRPRPPGPHEQHIYCIYHIVLHCVVYLLPAATGTLPRQVLSLSLSLSNFKYAFLISSAVACEPTPSTESNGLSEIIKHTLFLHNTGGQVHLQTRAMGHVHSGRRAAPV
jgi:hypothetical protein